MKRDQRRGWHGGSVGLAAWLATLLGVSGSTASAQVVVCSQSGFSGAAGSTACDGSASPVTITATVRTYAHLALDEIFGRPATELQVAMGDIDARCASAPAPGISCASDAASAVWYGDIKFRVKLAGVGASRAKITGVRPAEGSIPSGRLLDGLAGSPPLTSYPLAPASPIELRTGIGAGETPVGRSIGLRVISADPPGAWSGSAIWSLVLE